MTGEHVKNCPHCGASLERPVEKPGFSLDWRRSALDKRVAGVCGGLAKEFGIPAALLRLSFVLATLLAGGAGLVIYAALWVIMAVEPTGGSYHHEHGSQVRAPEPTRTVGENASESPPGNTPA